MRTHLYRVTGGFLCVQFISTGNSFKRRLPCYNESTRTCRTSQEKRAAMETKVSTPFSISFNKFGTKFFVPSMFIHLFIATFQITSHHRNMFKPNYTICFLFSTTRAASKCGWFDGRSDGTIAGPIRGYSGSACTGTRHISPPPGRPAEARDRQGLLQRVRRHAPHHRQRGL